MRRSGRKRSNLIWSSYILLLAGSSSICVSSDLAWLDVPFVRQVRAGCGSAAVAMVMQYWARQDNGLDAAAAAAERIDKALPRSPKGIHGKDLARYLEAHGFSVFVFNGELSDLRHHLSKGRPTVVCLGSGEPNTPYHFVVVAGVGKDAIMVNDPARGKLVRNGLETFLHSWRATGNWTLLAVPRGAS